MKLSLIHKHIDSLRTDSLVPIVSWPYIYLTNAHVALKLNLENRLLDYGEMLKHPHPPSFVDEFRKNSGTNEALYEFNWDEWKAFEATKPIGRASTQLLCLWPKASVATQKSRGLREAMDQYFDGYTKTLAAQKHVSNVFGFDANYLTLVAKMTGYDRMAVAYCGDDKALQIISMRYELHNDERCVIMPILVPWDVYEDRGIKEVKFLNPTFIPEEAKALAAIMDDPDPVGNTDNKPLMAELREELDAIHELRNGPDPEPEGDPDEDDAIGEPDDDTDALPGQWDDDQVDDLEPVGEPQPVSGLLKLNWVKI